MSEVETKLVACKKCKKEVENNIEKCPHCGEDYPTVSNKDTLKTLLIIGVVIWIFVAIFSDGDSFEDHKDTTLKEAKHFSPNKLKEIAKTYVEEKELSVEYTQKFYDCLGELVQDKLESYTVGKMMGWCQEDYNLSPNMKQYYNTTELLELFSPYDGSYFPLERVIKDNMNDSSSYEHVKTTRRFVYHGTNLTRPYMYVRTKFRGSNALGGIVINTVSVKVDATTKEVFDFQNE